MEGFDNVSDVAPSEAPSPVDTLKAAIEARKAEWPKEGPGKAKAPVPTLAAPEKSKVEDTTPAVVPAPVSDATKTVEEKTAPAVSPAEPAPDLSWLPERLRDKASSLDPELLDWTRSNAFRQSDYTKKTQKIAEREKEIDGFKKRADLWERLEGRPDVAETARRMLAGESLSDIVGAAPSSESEFAYHGAEDRDIDRHVETLADKKVRQAFEKRQAEDTAEKKRQSAVGRALGDYAEENGLDMDTMLAAAAGVNEQIEALGVEVTPKNAVSLFRPHIALVLQAAAPKTNGAAKAASPGLSRVASPIGQGVGARAPASPPSFLGDKKWPETDAERLKMFEYIAAKRQGPS